MACMECAPKVNYRKVGVCWEMKEEPVVQKVWRYDERLQRTAVIVWSKNSLQYFPH